MNPNTTQRPIGLALPLQKRRVLSRARALRAEPAVRVPSCHPFEPAKAAPPSGGVNLRVQSFLASAGARFRRLRECFA
jgi:hypothetical protein